MRYDAVLLDNDGVLTELTDLDVLEAAIRDAFREHGVTDPSADTVHALVGVTPESLESVCASHGIDDPASFWATRDRLAADAQGDLVTNGGKSLYDDVDAVGALEIPRGIVSNNQHETIRRIVEHYGLDWAETWYGRQPTIADVARKKPAPYYVERATTDLGADRPLLVGDSNADLGAAAAAGIDAAFLRRDHRESYALEHEPTYELTGLDDLPAIVTGG